MADDNARLLTDAAIAALNAFPGPIGNHLASSYVDAANSHAMNGGTWDRFEYLLHSARAVLRKTNPTPQPSTEDTVTTPEPIEYIVIRTSISGSLEKTYFGYEQYGPRHPSAEKAVSHGWETFGHDDFSLGRVQGDRLIWFGWMDEETEETDEDFAEIAKQLNLTPDRAKAVA